MVDGRRFGCTVLAGGLIIANARHRPSSVTKRVSLSRPRLNWFFELSQKNAVRPPCYAP